jgi:hypothetical protein
MADKRCGVARSVVKSNPPSMQNYTATTMATNAKASFPSTVSSPLPPHIVTDEERFEKEAALLLCDMIERREESNGANGHYKTARQESLPFRQVNHRFQQSSTNNNNQDCNRSLSPCVMDYLDTFLEELDAHDAELTSDPSLQGNFEFERGPDYLSSVMDDFAISEHDKVETNFSLYHGTATDSINSKLHNVNSMNQYNAKKRIYTCISTDSVTDFCPLKSQKSDEAAANAPSTHPSKRLPRAKPQIVGPESNQMKRILRMIVYMQEVGADPSLLNQIKSIVDSAEQKHLRKTFSFEHFPGAIFDGLLTVLTASDFLCVFQVSASFEHPRIHEMGAASWQPPLQADVWKAKLWDCPAMIMNEDDCAFEMADMQASESLVESVTDSALEGPKQSASSRTLRGRISQRMQSS